MRRKLSRTDQELYQRIGRRLRGIRLDNGLSQPDMALLMDTTREGISLMEQGKQQVRVHQLLRLCERYTLDPSYFLEEHHEALP